MKLLILSSVLVFCFFCIFFFTSFNGIYNYYNTSKEEQLVDKFLDRVPAKIAKKFHIVALGTGAGMPGGIIEHFKLVFEVHSVEPVHKDVLRKLIYEIAIDLLDEVNAQEDMKKYFIHCPFTLDDIEVVLFMRDKGNGHIYYPSIGVASFRNHELSFRTIESAKSFGYKTEEIETYEEAAAILQKASSK